MSNFKIPEIREIYRVITKQNDHGIEGYHVDNKYIDARKIRQDKQFQQASKKNTRPSKIKQVKHKTTYLDTVQKQAAKLPSPFSYNLNGSDIGQISKRSKGQGLKNTARRKTIFDEMEKQLLKDNYPGSANYNSHVEISKANKKSTIDKAQGNYVESEMRHSIQVPGIGQYNGKDDRIKWNGHFIKWRAPIPIKIKKPAAKFPEVGTYTPHPVTYDLFDSMNSKSKQKKTVKTVFGTQARWKSIDPKKASNSNYNILSEWGMVGKLKKKDILQKISRAPRASVYY